MYRVNFMDAQWVQMNIYLLIHIKRAMNLMIKVGYGMVILILLVGCQKEDQLSSGLVDEALQPFLEAFESEGLARNYQPVFSTDLVHMRLDTLPNSVTGQCKTYSDGRKEVVVSSAFWAQATFYEKEFLVFHELGHCILDRVHTESTNDRGQCNSIMHSGQGTCRNIYGAGTRRAYLDELFYYE